MWLPILLERVRAMVAPWVGRKAGTAEELSRLCSATHQTLFLAAPEHQNKCIMNKTGIIPEGKNVIYPG
jgi:hypothetical protein